MQMGAIAAPITYEVNGEQYIAFMAGWAGAPGLYVTVPCADGKRASTGRILAYKLGGNAKLPPASGPEPIPEPPPRQPMGEAEFAQAGALCARHCGF